MQLKTELRMDESLSLAMQLFIIFWCS